MDLLSGDDANNSASASSSNMNNNDSSSTTTTDAKIERDLAVVEEKLDLFQSLVLNPPPVGQARPSIQHDESVRSVIGFLEACGPRLVELISSDDPGLLGETVLMRCLQVQERLIQTLEEVETLALTETTASTTTASAANSSSNNNNQTPEFFVDLDNTPGHGTAASAPPPANAKTTGEEEDPFGNVVSNNTGPPAAGGAAPTGKSEGSDFDDFFSERQQQGS